MFFRAKDPTSLKRWYQQHLGVTVTPADYEQRPWHQEAGPTAFEPFPARLHDPEGNPVELWQPEGRDARGE